MSVLGDVRQALADTITAAVDNFHVYPEVPDMVIPVPCGVVQPDEGDYTYVQGEPDALIQLSVIVLVSRGGEFASAQALLDGLISPQGFGSVAQALLDEPTLGDVVEFAVVTGFDRYGRFNFGQGEYLGARLRMTVDA